ncbi:hypothetical protein [Escherichia phage vB_EcoM_EP57]|nr:hypothetical protein [Escherichia phage vB_EcoM_EP57]
MRYPLLTGDRRYIIFNSLAANNETKQRTTP